MHPTMIANLAALREELLRLSPDMIADEALLLDTIDGETNAMDAVRAIVRAAIEAEDYAGAVGRRQDELAKRKARLEARAIACRAAVMACMEALGITKLPAEDFTASLGAGRPSVVITDSDKLPLEFLRTTVSPMKTEIGKALKAGEDVPGATLSNPIPTLTITKV